VWVAVLSTGRDATAAKIRTWPGAGQGGAYGIVGGAWGGEVAKVEVRVDGDACQLATIDLSEASEFARKSWHLDWATTSPGEHTITSWVTDATGRVQPAMDVPSIVNERTYWKSNGQVTRRIRVALPLVRWPCSTVRPPPFRRSSAIDRKPITAFLWR
jgi:hypothetical protein